jgi:hypothetical protein
MDLAKVGVLSIAVCAGLVLSCKTNSINDTTNNSGGQIVGAQGGTVLGPEGEALLIPPGALTTDTAFMARAADQNDVYPAAGNYFWGGNQVFAFQPHGQQFFGPVTVVVPFVQQFQSPLLLQAEKGDTQWREVPVTGTKVNALETTVSTLSYFVVAQKGMSMPPDGGADVCAQRMPMMGLMSGSVTNASGTIPATFFGGPNPTAVDASTLVGGYAGPSQQALWGISLTTYPNSCGYLMNNDSSIGSSTLVLLLASQPTGPGPATLSGIGHGQVPSTTPVGSCSPPGGGGAAEAGSSVTISGTDGASFIAGSFDVFVSGVEIKGDFNVPICTVTSSPQPQCCK